MDNRRDVKITGKDLYAKFQELMPGGILKKISPEVLNETCNHPSTQPFLKWFCEYVGPDNILTKEEIRLRDNLKKNGQWLTEKALDDALVAALEEYQELIPLIESDRNYELKLAKNYEVEKEAYEADLKDLKVFEEELKYLKEHDAKLSQELKSEETFLQKMKIQQDKIYRDFEEDCEKFDAVHHELYNAIQNLLNIYSDAAQMKGPPITWTQMPLELFVNQIETHYKYIQFNIQKEHKNLLKTEESLENSENTSLTTDKSDNERTEMEKVQEIVRCQKNIESSTLYKIEAEIEKVCCEISHSKAKEIYNNGDIKFPQSEAQKNIEITQMLSARDLLEEENLILESQLKDCVESFSKLSVTKISIEEAEARLKRKQKRLEKFEHLLYLARDLGHSNGDFLSLLMQLELRKFQKIINLITSTRSYLQMEYTLSAKRTDIMKELQAQFNEIISSPLSEQNVYNRICSEMMINDTSSPDAFNLAEKMYRNILTENEKLKEEILETDLDDVICKLNLMKNNLMIAYDKELNSGATKSFRFMPDDLVRQFETVSKKSETIKNLFNETRKKFKYFSDKISNDPIEREKQILWQKFLANPEGLKARYDELQSIAERSHFVNSLHSE